jgi:hypothetical protein
VHLSLGETARATGAVSLSEAGETLFLEPADPVLYGARGVAEDSAHLRRGHSLSDQKEPVEPMIIPGLVGPTNLILKGKDHVLGIRYGQWSHGGTSSHSWTRNYLRRRV